MNEQELKAHIDAELKKNFRDLHAKQWREARPKLIESIEAPLETNSALSDDDKDHLRLAIGHIRQVKA